MQRETEGRAETTGRLTLTNLSRLDPFCAAQVSDAWGVPRAPFSLALARMSAELAANGYTLDIHPWVRAGWTDSTFVVEDRVVVLDRDSDSKLAAIESEWKRYRAKSLIHGVRPIGDLLRAARQFLVTDMGKALVMARALPDGRACVAVSFVGTTQKYFDWFSNFKFQQRDGMHSGFLELARQFDAQARRIALPALAAAMGRDSLTLADVAAEAAHPDGRFLIWLSGHSQGGAIVQTYAHLLMEKGIPFDRIHGYTFAAPTVAAQEGVPDPKAYPVYNLINGDDLVPRVGAQIRLGVDCVFFPDDAFRAAHYRTEEPARAAYERISHIVRRVRTMPDALSGGVALMRLLIEAEEDTEIAAFFAELMPPLSVLKRTGIRQEEVAQYVAGKLNENMRALLGEEPDEALAADFTESLRDAIRFFGGKPSAAAMRLRLFAPHRIAPDKRDDAFLSPYIAIVRRHLDELTFGVWTHGDPPFCADIRGGTVLPC